MYYLAGTSEEPPQAILKELNVWNGFAWFDELKAAFLKFPVADKFTGANCDCKKFGYPKCVGRGVAIDDTHTSLYILLKNDQNITYINLFTVILLSGQP